MKSQELISKLYFRMQYRKKTYEQLQIGKIKFEVIPIYFNNTCVYSMFKLKYTQASISNIGVQTRRYPLLKVLLLVLMLFCIYIVLYNLLVNLGILVETNEVFTNIITPYIFPDLPVYYTPHLTTLLKNVNLLTP